MSVPAEDVVSRYWRQQQVRVHSVQAAVLHVHHGDDGPHSRPGLALQGREGGRVYQPRDKAEAGLGRAEILE